MDKRFNLSSFIYKNALLLIIMVAVLLRIITIDQSLWHDEAITALAARDFGFKRIVSEFAAVDNHTPLYYLILRLWGGIFGFTEVVMRMLSVSIGIATIYVINKLIIFTNKDKKLAFWTSALLAVSSLHIYYSQEIRMYVLSTFLAVCSTYFYLKIIKLKNNFDRNFIYFGISILLLMASDYVPAFFLPVFWVYAFISRKNKRWWRNFLLSHVFLVIFAVLWAPVFVAQVRNYQSVLTEISGWRNVVGGATIKQLALFWTKAVFGRISLDNSVYYPLLIIFSIPHAYLLKKSFSNNNLLTILWFIFPLTLGFVVSYIFPAFIYFRFIYVIPAFYYLISLGAQKLQYGKYILISILLINLFSLAIYYSDDSQQREDWKSVVKYTENRAREDGSAIVFNYYLIPAGFRWYTLGYENVHAIESEKELRDVFTEQESFYYFDYLEDIYDPQHEVKASLESSLFEQGQIFDFNGVGQVRYYQRK